MKVAIVHYWLTGMRGGEKMLEAILEIFPDADIWTHVFNPLKISEKIKSKKIYTSYINRLPFAKKIYPVYMPLMPGALTAFNLQDYELIISSESGPAKGVVPSPTAYHICYCHTPMRYIWDMYHVYGRDAGAVSRLFMRILTPALRVWDITSSNLVDRFITNSSFTALRIKRYYNRDADVVYGPVEIERFINRERNPKDFYLVLGQVTYNKKVDIAVEACIKLNKKLVVGGAVSDKKLINRYKKIQNITFTGALSEREIEDYLSEAKALLFPGIEDLGLVPIEAQAAGCPVIALRKGGVTDTVKDGLTGLFFNEQSPASLADAIKLFEETQESYQNRTVFSSHVRQFSKQAFIERVKKIINERKRV